MQQCSCEHWQECPVCAPRRFDKDGKKLPPEPAPLQDARAKLEAMESHAKRLALSLECLLLSCKDIAAVSKWWDSSHVALTEYQAAIDLLYPPKSVGWVETCNCRFCGAAAAKARAERLTQVMEKKQ